MSAKRFSAIMLIFISVAAAWAILGGSVYSRTETLDSSTMEEMQSLWGPPIVGQSSPIWTSHRHTNGQRYDTIPTKSAISAHITHENRDKGLLWYSTFMVDFRATYTVPALHPESEPTEELPGKFMFNLPALCTPIDLTVKLDNQPIKLPYKQKISGQLEIPLVRDKLHHTISISYKTKGLDAWAYFPGRVDICQPQQGYDNTTTIPATRQTGELQDFSLTITTDFANIDYPRGSLSPNVKATTIEGGMKAQWQFQNLISDQPMGIFMPKRQNAGPIVARMSFFAPVSLFFFFTVLFTVVVLKKIPLHPMHYMFIAAGFFAFHILLAYLADQMSLQPAFWLCAIISVLLVVSYMRLVAGVKFAVFYAGAAQLVYLVGFSYAFFWVGITGLAVTIGAIATLFVLMQATGRVDWSEVFAGNPSKNTKSLNIPPLPTATASETFNDMSEDNTDTSLPPSASDDEFE